MDGNIWAFLPVALLVLACPLGCVGMGAAVWFAARLRGQRRGFSAGCMSDDCASHDEKLPGATPIGSATEASR